MEFGGIYGVQHLPHAKFPGFCKPLVKERLTKWSLMNGLRVQAFSFNRPFKFYLQDEFIKEFFACQAVTGTMEKVNADGNFSLLGVPGEVVKFSQVKCTQTTMDLFDQLTENESIIRQGGRGAIVPCIPEYIDPNKYLGSGSSGDSRSSREIEVGDNLRKVILATLLPAQYVSELDIQEDALQNALISSQDSDEFIFQLFAHLVIGGSCCQYEDCIIPYLDCTRILYKDLVSVSVEENGELRVISNVYKIHLVSSSLNSIEEQNMLFYKEQFNNFCYLIVNPQKQICFTLYHHV